MSSYIVPGIKLTSLTSIDVLTNDDLLYVVDVGTNTSRKTTYDSLTSNIVRDFQTVYSRVTGGVTTGTITVTGLSATDFFYTTAANFATPSAPISGGVVIPYNLNSVLYLSSTQTSGSIAASREWVTAELAGSVGVSPTYVYQRFVPLSGATVTNNISSNVVPFNGVEYVNLSYLTGGYVPATGGSFTGAISAPTPTKLDPATRVATVGYVETRVALSPGAGVTSGNAFPIDNSNGVHSNLGAGNTGSWSTLFIDNNLRLRQCGPFGTKYNYGGNARGSGAVAVDLATIFPETTIQFASSSEAIKTVCSVGCSTLVLTNSGRVYTAGFNSLGQVGLPKGTNPTTFHNLTTAFFTGKIDKIITSRTNAYANLNQGSSFALTGGDIWAWGSNAAGQLGIGSKIDAYTPVPIKLLPSPGPILGANIVKVASSGTATLGQTFCIDDTNILYATGNGIYGTLGLSAGIVAKTQLADVVPAQISTFWPVPLWGTQITTPATGSAYVRPYIIDSKITAEQVYTAGSNTYILTGGQVWGCGINGRGALGVGSVLGYQAPGPRPGALANYTKYTSIPYFTQVLSASNSPLGAVQYLTTSGDFTIAGGQVSVCAVITAAGLPTGVYDIKVWGFNGSGQLGMGNNSNVVYATRPTTAPYGITKAKMAGQGATASLFLLTTSGDIYVAGDNTSSIFGDGTVLKNSSTFNKVTRPGNIQFRDFEVFCTNNLGATKTVLAVSDSYQLYTWGDNTWYQTGKAYSSPVTPEVSIPQRVQLG